MAVQDVYSLASESTCCRATCPVMCAGEKYKFYWKDEKTGKLAGVDAPAYARLVLRGVQGALRRIAEAEEEAEAGRKAGEGGAEGERRQKHVCSLVAQQYRRVIRILYHCFYHHYSSYEQAGRESELVGLFQCASPLLHSAILGQILSSLCMDALSLILPRHTPPLLTDLSCRILAHKTGQHCTSTCGRMM
eukprot:TRINITY_DN3047_c0_g1_i3.p1 TRINITY_DN3047_c0_g1~~TRINITY_DN3047_c0_g1_i3.p1  ORF type:complete len:191 (+),score=30.82 TRINITY_DN3047_c0_g1_i3:109-681(+)